MHALVPGTHTAVGKSHAARGQHADKPGDGAELERAARRHADASVCAACVHSTCARVRGPCSATRGGKLSMTLSRWTGRPRSNSREKRSNSGMSSSTTRAWISSADCHTTRAHINSCRARIALAWVGRTSSVAVAYRRLLLEQIGLANRGILSKLRVVVTEHASPLTSTLLARARQRAAATLQPLRVAVCGLFALYICPDLHLGLKPRRRSPPQDLGP